MKRLIVLCLVILVSSLAALAQNAPDAAELTKMLNEFLAGASKNDPAAHDRFWADDLIYTRSAGVRTTKAEIMNGLKAAAAPKPDDPVTVYSAEDIQIHQYGTMAVVAFRLVINATAKDGTKKVSSNLNTGVFLKRKGMWHVVAWQSTVMPQPTPESKKSTATAEPSIVNTPKTDGARTYLKGSRSGCYYVNPTGGKVYVDHKNCQ